MREGEKNSLIWVGSKCLIYKKYYFPSFTSNIVVVMELDPKLDTGPVVLPDLCYGGGGEVIEFQMEQTRMIGSPYLHINYITSQLIGAGLLMSGCSKSPASRFYMEQYSCNYATPRRCCKKAFDACNLGALCIVNIKIYIPFSCLANFFL